MLNSSMNVKVTETKKMENTLMKVLQNVKLEGDNIVVDMDSLFRSEIQWQVKSQKDKIRKKKHSVVKSRRGSKKGGSMEIFKSKKSVMGILVSVMSMLYLQLSQVQTTITITGEQKMLAIALMSLIYLLNNVGAFDANKRSIAFKATTDVAIESAKKIGNMLTMMIEMMMGR